MYNHNFYLALEFGYTDFLLRIKIKLRNTILINEKYLKTLDSSKTRLNYMLLYKVKFFTLVNPEVPSNHLTFSL